MGLWLLIPEYLRLGVWDLLRGWTAAATGAVEPRLALQCVNESALCVRAIRAGRCLSQKGFEVANGLPFVATDQEIHRLCQPRRMEESVRMQVALGRLRAASGHFKSHLLAIDPHRMPSASKRQMPRHKPKPQAPADKCAQAYFSVDAETSQPVCAYLGSSAVTVAQATPFLLDMAAQILHPKPHSVLAMADTEHCLRTLFTHVQSRTPFDLITPLPSRDAYLRQLRQLPADRFTRHWAGYATATTPFHFDHAENTHLLRFVQRTGETPSAYHYKAFLCTGPREELRTIAEDYPTRWHAEEFFNLEQDLGWKKAGTLNLNIRYARMSLALIAQAAIHQLRQQLPSAARSWSASHLAADIFSGLDGDLRVSHDRIIVTYYNADRFGLNHAAFLNSPERLAKDGVDPRVPWLYDFKVDFRFR